MKKYWCLRKASSRIRRAIGMKRIRAISVFILFAAVFAFLPVFTLTARAGMSPMPFIKVNFVNLPGDEIYIDILINEPLPEDNSIFRYGSMDLEPDVNYDGRMLNALINYSPEGWRPAMVTGTRLPLRGELRRKVYPDGSASAVFEYSGILERIKIIVATQDGSVAVSNVIESKDYNRTVNIDYSAKTVGSADYITDDGYKYYEITAVVRNPAVQTAKQLALTLSTTFIVEGLLLVLFRFSLRCDWKPFVFVNLGTQIALNLLLSLSHTVVGQEVALFVFLYVISVILVLIIETALFIRLLKHHSKLRRALYAIVANIASFVVGLYLLGNFVF